ncbi:hypothetical protein F511_46694 [Dorcoceras hygrometricum]|uniref:Uncharacterized protein n=1 Tax=Dorcoceras hygrometricum TaxID=472368 RepID=A0A2Z6ZTX6_9LAMI|nr:hypothetical protein F511_46694 [Dorcoceras hygrometricum]
MRCALRSDARLSRSLGHVMGGLSRNGCAIDGRCVRAGRALRLDARRLLRTQIVAHIAGWCRADGSATGWKHRATWRPLLVRDARRWPARVATLSSANAPLRRAASRDGARTAAVSFSWWRRRRRRPPLRRCRDGWSEFF